MSDHHRAKLSTIRLQKRLSLREAIYLRQGQWRFESRDKLIFLHVPKSGGTSFDAFTTSFFEDQEILPADRQSLIAADWKESFWSEHRYFKVGYWYDRLAAQKQSAHFFTLLRDPVKRVVSYYWHLRRKSDFTDQFRGVVERRSHETTLANSATLAEWAATPLTHEGAYPRNATTAALTIGWLPLRLLPEEKYPAILERAKQVLRYELACFGLVEEYERSKEVFCRTFGLPLHYAQGEERCNTSPFAEARERPDTAAIEQIRRDNWLDVELYKYARQLFEERFDDLRRLPPDRLMKRRWAWPRMFTPDGQLSLKLDELRGSGLYRPETTAAGQRYSWTGQFAMTTLDFAASVPRRGEAIVRLHTVANVTPLEQVRLRLDGVSATSTTIDYFPGHQEIVCRFSLEPEHAAKLTHQLTIDAPAQIPSAMGGTSGDRRQLGVAISQVDIAWRRDRLKDKVRSLIPQRAA